MDRKEQEMDFDGKFLGTYAGRRVWLMPNGDIEVMFNDRPIRWETRDRRDFDGNFARWLERRGIVFS